MSIQNKENFALQMIVKHWNETWNIHCVMAELELQAREIFQRNGAIAAIP
jgi:hypothetical protein